MNALRSCSLERLEARKLLTVSGDFAVLDGDVLRVTGDADDNVFRVSIVREPPPPGAVNGPARVVVEGDGSTLTFPVDNLRRLAIDGGDGNDSVEVALALFDGALPATTILGGGGDDTISSASGFDSILGGAGNDSIVGGSGDDTITGGAGADSIFGTGGQDSLEGGDDDDVLDGGTGDDEMAGGAGDDQLFGRGGTERFDGGAGADLIDGGSGQIPMALNGDTVPYTSRTADLQITLGDGLANDGEASENDTLLNVEHAEGGAGNDLIVGTSLNNILQGHGGNDTLFGHGGNDNLSGQGGNDSVDGGTGNDGLGGGTDDDTVMGQGGNDRITEDDGDDLLDGGSGDDVIDDRAGSDTVFGRGGDDHIIAGADHDTANFPANSADSYSGGGGRDTIDYSEANTLIIGGATITPDGVANDGRAGENDNVDATFEVFIGTPFDDTIDLTGFTKPARVFGGAGNDTILGGTRSDTLEGGDGDDELRALDGIADTVDGGDGDDSAERDAALDVLTSVENVI